VDDADGFVAHGEALFGDAAGEGHVHHWVGEFVEEVHVAAADGGHGHFDDDFAGAGLGDIDVDYFDSAVFVGFHTGFHWGCPPFSAWGVCGV
jgi:hypothetical protein